MSINPWMLAPGTLVAGRFEIENLAGSGGMGTVFRAHDRYTGDTVALKVLSSGATVQDTERFFREARILSRLSHPGIVTYVAHGRTPEGLLYLALEWIRGEDLAQRLMRQSLGVAESLTLVRVVAEALAAMHRHGIIHRDIKPSNLLLRDSRVERVTILDFGIARLGESSMLITPTGEVLGTLNYIAPEQARGDQLVGTGADVFALGCVLYECLAGTPPFAGGHLAVVLTRILHEEVPPLRRVRPELPPTLEQLVGRMLAKQPEARLHDGQAVVDALAELERTSHEPELWATPPPSPFLGTEQRLVSTVLAMPLAPAGTEARTLDFGKEGDPLAASRAALEACAEQVGGKLERQPGGTVLITLVREGDPATDLAMRAGMAALRVREHMVDAIVVATTGPAVLAQGSVEGEALDRARQLLLERTAPGQIARPGVWLDELTARLGEGRLRVRRDEDGALGLEGRRDGRASGAEPGPGPLVLPFVGREQELQMLEMLLGGCIEEGESRAVLVIGPPGAGKSRLRREFEGRLAAQGEPVEVLRGEGDPLAQGTPYGLIGRCLRALCGLDEEPEAVLAPASGSGAEPPQAQERARARLLERVSRHLAPPDRERVVGLLGELCGVPFPDESSAALRAARQDPRRLGEEAQAAFVDFLRAECAAHPVVLVLEDLQWSDAATLRLVDAALRGLGERPLFVLGLGRSELREMFPGLWQGCHLQELHLPGLGRKASERLVREGLRARATAEVTARIVEQAGGSPLLLEELVRAEAEGREPELALAMQQARLLRLESGARRVVRAASIFGETFWRGGLVELLGVEVEAELDEWLGILVEDSLVAHHAESRLGAEAEYGFRSGLLRAAAYRLVTEPDRRAGHRLVGSYLERMGARDARALAEHFERGGEPRRAAMYRERPPDA